MMYFTPSRWLISLTFSPPISAGAFFVRKSVISALATGGPEVQVRRVCKRRDRHRPKQFIDHFTQRFAGRGKHFHQQQAHDGTIAFGDMSLDEI